MILFGSLPSGTGGDFRKTIGVSAHVREAAKVFLREDHPRVIDVVRVSFLLAYFSVSRIFDTAKTDR